MKGWFRQTTLVYRFFLPQLQGENMKNSEKEMLEMVLKMLKSMDERLVNSLPQLFTSQEAADYLGVREQTLKIWRVQGVGPSFCKVEKCVRYSFDDLKNYLNQQKINH
jgi:hypothetical protein